MKSPVLLIFLFSLLCLAPGEGRAGTVASETKGLGKKGFGGMDGNELLPMCDAAVEQLEGKTLSPSEHVNATRCASYIEGFLDAYVMRYSTPEKPAKFCFQYPASSAQVGHPPIKTWATRLKTPLSASSLS